MNHLEFQLRGVGDPRLALHATSALPAWLWSADGTRILWANPVGARLFGAANSAALAEKIFGPADQHRRQVAQLASRLPLNGAIRLERLRGFGAALGTLVTCGCARLDFADGSHGILVAAAEAVGRSCRWSSGCSGWSKASMRRSRRSRATACSSAPATPRDRCSAFAISPRPASTTRATTRCKQGRAERHDRHRPSDACSASAAARMSAWSRCSKPAQQHLRSRRPHDPREARTSDRSGNAATHEASLRPPNRPSPQGAREEFATCAASRSSGRFSRLGRRVRVEANPAEPRRSRRPTTKRPRCRAKRPPSSHWSMNSLTSRAAPCPSRDRRSCCRSSDPKKRSRKRLLKLLRLRTKIIPRTFALRRSRRR